jgi:hypothetical protein
MGFDLVTVFVLAAAPIAVGNVLGVVVLKGVHGLSPEG